MPDQQRSVGDDGGGCRAVLVSVLAVALGVGVLFCGGCPGPAGNPTGGDMDSNARVRRGEPTPAETIQFRRAAAVLGCAPDAAYFDGGRREYRFDVDPSTTIIGRTRRELFRGVVAAADYVSRR